MDGISSDVVDVRQFVSRVIQVAKSNQSGVDIETTISCVHPHCSGFLTIRSQDVPSQVHWRCRVCHETGVLLGSDQKMGSLAHAESSDPLLQHKTNIDHWLGSVEPAWKGMSYDEIVSINDGLRFEDGAVIFNHTLTQHELENAPLFFHAHLFLSFIASEKVRLTVKGNLNRKCVESMLDQFQWPEHDAKKYREFNKVMNEEDFFPLHLVHIIVKIAGLVRKYKGNLVITKKGTELLQPDNAGKLHAHLFKTFYGEFNLSYLDGISLPSIFQDQIGTIIYLIGKVASDWVSPNDLVRMTVIPDKDFFDHSVRDVEFAFRLRVIQSLKWMGLLEKKMLSEPKAYPEIFEVKKTVLFDRFLSYST